MTDQAPQQVNLVSRATLPIAAQRWLDRALPHDLATPSSIQIEQAGTMELRGSWTPFEATGIYKVPPLSFNWRARFRMMPGVWIVAEDGHQDGQGWGGARLWGILPMGKRTDPEVLASQLVRNLAELVWLPPFALADPALAWAGSDENAFEVRSRAGDWEAVVRFEVDEQGDVLRAHSPARPYDIAGGYAEAPWTYELSEHQEIGGLRVPAAVVASFDKGDGPEEYLQMRVRSIMLDTTPR